VADATGDGVPDVAGILDGHAVLLDAGGRLVWEVPRAGAPDTGGISMADLDADGVYEIVDWGEAGLVLRDGRTGAVLAERTDVGTLLAFNPPAVADVDGDGSADLVVSGDPAGLLGPNAHVYVFGAARGRWARTRPVWNQVPYDAGAITDKGVPVWPGRPGWQTENTFRAQPAHDGERPDLVVITEGSCTEGATAGRTVRIAVRVVNVGSREATAGASIRVIGWDGERLDELATVVVAEPIPAGTATAGIAIDLSAQDWATVAYIEVADEGDDCDPLNNRLAGTFPAP
jgi:hypothetical protein